MAANTISNNGGTISVQGVVGDNSSVTYNGVSASAPRLQPTAAPRQGSRLPYSGKDKLRFVQRLSSSYIELADVLEIPPHDLPSGAAGARYIWNWLDARGRLGDLLDALTLIERTDLVAILDKD